MSDIVERLRESWNMPELPAWVQNNWTIRQEAAEEIERLRAENAELLGAARLIRELEAEIVRLRGENSMLVTEAALHDKTDADLARENSRLNAHITKQDAEIERLTAALQRIADNDLPDGVSTQDIARATLGGEMSDILDDLRAVLKSNGDTYSSMEVLGMIGRAIAEIERLRAEGK